MVNIDAVSGRPADIQPLIYEVAETGDGYGNVIVPDSIGQTPDDRWHWNGESVLVIGGVNVLTRSLAGCSDHPYWTPYAPSCMLHNDKPQVAGSPPPTMFQLGPPDPGPPVNKRASRISGFQLEATPPITADDENLGGAVGVGVTQLLDAVVDHMTFKNFAGTQVGVSANSGWNMSSTATALIHNCVVDNPYKLVPPLGGGDWAWSYGFYAGGNYRELSQWDPDVSHFFGKYGPLPAVGLMYVEDCHLSLLRHSFDVIQGGFYCARYNLLDKPACTYQAGSINVHGGNWMGRGAEAYGNTIIGSTVKPWGTGGRYDSCAISLRGSSGLYHDNTFLNDVYNQYAYFHMLGLDDPNTPAALQVQNTYIFGNNQSTNCTFLNKMSQYVEGVNYFLRAPNQAQDGFTYTPYPYPHPLRGITPQQRTLNVESNILNTPFTVRRLV